MKISSGQLYYTYVTTNPGKSVLYIGMTNDLKRRLSEHYENRGKKDHFASKFYCYKLLYYEIFETAIEAIQREKAIKNLTREKKLELIRLKNAALNFIII